MILIVNTPSVNPYKNSNDYQKKATELNIEYRGITYYKKITYEKEIDLIHRVAIGALAFLATVTIIPYCCNSEKVNIWWFQAINGVDREVVLIRENNDRRHVQFGQSRGRLFHNEESPDLVAQIDSIQLRQLEEEAPQAPLAPQTRTIPPLSPCDTITMINGEIRSEHGDNGQLFLDDEIVEKLEIIRRVKIDPAFNIYANYSIHEKAIIQQQARRGCTAATAAMLILDNERRPNLTALCSRNLGNDRDMIRDIQAAGLVATVNRPSTLSELRALLIENGPAIVTVSGRLSSHVIVVDAISEDLAHIRVRDPHHGWEITVTQAAFLQEWRGSTAIQVEQQIH